MLYLVRHGETEFNRSGRFQGHMDSALTSVGRDQAHAVGRKLWHHLNGCKFLLLSSPLGRAKSTAQIIQSHMGGSEIQFDDRLAEIDIGDWSGMTMDDIEFTHPGALDGSTRYDWGFRAPGGETKEMFLRRLKSWLSELTGFGVPVVGVSHGWAGLGLRSLYSGNSIDEVGRSGTPHDTIYHFANGEIAEFQCRDCQGNRP